MRYRVVGRFGVMRTTSSGRWTSTEPEGGAWVRVTAMRERQFAVSAVASDTKASSAHRIFARASRPTEVRKTPGEEPISDADLAAVLAALDEANDAADRVLKAADDSAHAFHAGLLELKEARAVLAASNRQAESRQAEENAAWP